MNEQQTDEVSELTYHMANLKSEVVKRIIQGSEFNPKLAKHAQYGALTIHSKEPERFYQHKQHAVNLQQFVFSS